MDLFAASLHAANSQNESNYLYINEHIKILPPRFLDVNVGIMLQLFSSFAKINASMLLDSHPFVYCLSLFLLLFCFVLYCFVLFCLSFVSKERRITDIQKDLFYSVQVAAQLPGSSPVAHVMPAACRT